MELAEKLKRLRKERRISQQAIAAECQVSQGLVSLWERGENVPSLLHGAKMAAMFGVSVDFLSREEDERSIDDVAAEIKVRDMARVIGWDAIYRRAVAQMAETRHEKTPAAHQEQRGPKEPTSTIVSRERDRDGNIERASRPKSKGA